MVRAYVVAMVILAADMFMPAAQAQVPYRTYAPPAGPSLPIQLDYFRPQSGVLDNYNQFVAPKEQLAGQIRGMAQQQNADFQAVEKQLRESDRIRESGAASTGVSAGFMTFSHDYNRSRAAAPAARAPRAVRQFAPSSPTMPSMGFGS